MWYIIHPAGQAPHRRSRLSSIVRQKVAALGCSPAPLGGSRRRMPSALLPRRHGGSRQQRACPACFAVKAFAALARSQGASRVAVSSLGVPLAARSSVGASGLGCNSRSRALAAVAGRSAAAQACARRQPNAGSASSGCRSQRRRFSPRRSSHRLPGGSCALHRGCCLTLRSSGRPPASRLGREALSVYHAPRGQAAFPASAPQLKR